MNGQIPLASRSTIVQVSRVGFMRIYFVALGMLYLIIAAIGFTPSYQAHFAGVYHIFPIAHIHGALMAIFLLLFVAQSYLVASGNITLHRKIGAASLVLAPLAWISMLLATRRPLVAEVLPVDHFLFDVLLVQLMLIVLFPVLFTWAIRARRNPAIHKRVMVFLIVVILQVAIDRMRWLPTFHLPKHFGSDIYVYLLLLPLLVFDLITLGRIHKATLICLAILLAGHVGVSILFESPSWHRLAFDLTNRMR
jgi:hypothetical protein